jgi:hypothetical protein
VFEIVVEVEVEWGGVLVGFEGILGVLVGATVLAFPVECKFMNAKAKLAWCWHLEAFSIKINN